MHFWIIYFFSSLVVSFLFSQIFKHYRSWVFLLLFTFLITPAPIELGSSGLAPSIFIFLYDLVLENTFSFRSLRPLALSLFGVIILFFIIKTIRRRFF